MWYLFTVLSFLYYLHSNKAFECPVLGRSVVYEFADESACYNIWRKCDGINDCIDKSDEDPEVCKAHLCREFEKKCPNGETCISDGDICDGYDHCGDGSDETNCEDFKCPSGSVKCRDGKQCISNIDFCTTFEGTPTCKDGSDKDREYCLKSDCYDKFVKCADGVQCLYSGFFCNGRIHCDDGSDEENCEDFQCHDGFVRCKDGEKCIEAEYMCDFDRAIFCWDRSDHNPEVCKEYSCIGGYSKCSDGQQCLKNEKFCDGVVNCRDHSDENGC